MNIESKYIDITKFLPHRAPMLMVDIIHELNNHKVITGFLIREDNLFVKNSIFTETGLIENAAQTCSSIVGKDFFIDDNLQIKEEAKVIGFISGIKKLFIHKCPKVNQEIKTHCELISRFDNELFTICSINCKTYCQEELLLESEINLFVQEIEA